MLTKEKGTIYAITFLSKSNLYYHDIFTNYDHGALIRNDIMKKVYFNTAKSDTSTEGFLAYIDVEDDKIILSKPIEKGVTMSNDFLNSLKHQIWMVICSPFNSYFLTNLNRYYYELKKNDIIRYRNVLFLVRDINLINHEVMSSPETLKFDLDTIFIKTDKTDLICRICLDKQSNDDDILISICKCKENMMAHLTCLKKLIHFDCKIRRILNGLDGFLCEFNTYNCKICLNPYPISIINNGQRINLINYENLISKKRNYLILQSLFLFENNKYKCDIYVLIFKNSKIIYPLEDVFKNYVPNHDDSIIATKFLVKDEKIYIEDEGLKNKTNILVTEPVDLTLKKYYHIGRTMIFYENDEIEKRRNNIRFYIDDNSISNIKKNDVFIVSRNQHEDKDK